MANGNWQELSAKKRRFWQAHVQAWGKSGLSQNDYCRRNQLKNNQFGYWKKKLTEQLERAVSFIPVPVDKPLSAPAGDNNSGLTVILRTGTGSVSGIRGWKKNASAGPNQSMT